MVAIPWHEVSLGIYFTKLNYSETLLLTAAAFVLHALVAN